MPQLRKLEQKYANELVVIGVHSGKFPGEKPTEAVRLAAQRLGIHHPVVNDRDFRLWQEYAVRAWPTLMFIDPHGKVMGRHEGEFDATMLDQIFGEMIDEFQQDGSLDRTPRTFHDPRAEDTGPLRFPGKLLADAGHDRLFVADTGHHRIVEWPLSGGPARRVLGSGEPGWADGDASAARFDSPQGLALAGSSLYVADTENHLLRRIDLDNNRVETIAGTGEQARHRHPGGPGRSVALNSPWDLAVHGESLYVAMAGFHQVWVMNLRTGGIFSWAGSGEENIADGRLAEAMLAQPSGLALDPDAGVLYVADSEVSAVRAADLKPGGVIRTLVGEGLFEFGDNDGVGAEARLQHPLAVALHRGTVYVADSYNHKVKRLDPQLGSCERYLGSGLPGLRDGRSGDAEFAEPGGLSVAGDRLYVADTNNHAIRVCDLNTAAVTTLPIQ